MTRAEIDSAIEHGPKNGSVLFTPTNVHVCEVPKGTEPLTVWLCDCGKYWAYKEWLFRGDGFCGWSPVSRNRAVRLITRAKKKANR